MYIRKANINDIGGLNSLLYQVLNVHHSGRPDIFKANAKKYNDEQLEEILKYETKTIFVMADENEQVLGYDFCIIQQYVDNNVLTDIKTLYIDDLCVDENARGQHIGKKLYEYVLSYAKQIECYNVTLNVWSCNQNALKFYEKQGLVPQKIYMEKIL